MSCAVRFTPAQAMDFLIHGPYCASCNGKLTTLACCCGETLSAIAVQEDGSAHPMCIVCGSFVGVLPCEECVVVINKIEDDDRSRVHIPMTPRISLQYISTEVPDPHFVQYAATIEGQWYPAGIVVVHMNLNRCCIFDPTGGPRQISVPDTIDVVRGGRATAYVVDLFGLALVNIE